ncbi:hypothetical protein AAG906_010334 [Vitis piasezkii]
MIPESSIVNVGECTITLQDVSIILGLPIDGVAIPGTTCLDWREVCDTLLGVVPRDRDISDKDFSVRCYARAFILQLIGGFLLRINQTIGFPFMAPMRLHPRPHDEIATTTFRHAVCIQPYWRDEFRTTSTPMHVLSQYRYLLDRLMPEQIIWEPYTDDVISALPDYCTIASDLWLTISPLICFHIVEWHRPDRVLRQFGLVQHIPEQCDTELGLHRYDWMSIHHHYIQSEAVYTLYGYRSITRLFTPHGSSWEIVRQSSDEDGIRDGGVRTRGGETRGGGVRTRGGGVRTRGGGVRSRGGGVRTRRSEIHEADEFLIPLIGGGVHPTVEVFALEARCTNTWRPYFDDPHFHSDDVAIHFPPSALQHSSFNFSTPLDRSTPYSSVPSILEG